MSALLLVLRAGDPSSNKLVEAWPSVVDGVLSDTDVDASHKAYYALEDVLMHSGAAIARRWPQHTRRFLLESLTDPKRRQLAADCFTALLDDLGEHGTLAEALNGPLKDPFCELVRSFLCGDEVSDTRSALLQPIARTLASGGIDIMTSALRCLSTAPVGWDDLMAPAHSASFPPGGVILGSLVEQFSVLGSLSSRQRVGEAALKCVELLMTPSSSSSVTPWFGGVWPLAGLMSVAHEGEADVASFLTRFRASPRFSDLYNAVLAGDAFLRIPGKDIQSYL
eukprot:gnl/Dysnectes_brevis/2506_a2997_1036.p1 GENE.gnl/Dysnectes_brevis/2506_a2997_1036~~gnl/Dysnectes_brevis/2506_a2997_1036.p1  ORF type:complete len:281 (+),score=55.97 gnl/Dysnectes_brevis/2506_a2997_1036:117-959(+)